MELEEQYMGIWGMETEYTLWAVFCVLFHFDALSGCKGRNVEELVSEHNAYVLQHSFEENLVQHMSVHEIVLTDCQLHDNWCNDSHSSLRGVNEFVSTLHIYCLHSTFTVSTLHIYCLHSTFTVSTLHIYCLYTPHLLPNLRKIQHKRSA